MYDVESGRKLHDLAGRVYTDNNLALAINARGDVARVQAHYNPGDRSGYQTVELDDAAGHRVVDQGTEIDPKSLRIEGNIVTWLRSGETRTAALSALNA